MPFSPVENPIFTHELEEPIQAFGETVKVIAIRKPTPGDMFRVGNPVRYDARDNSIDFDETKAFAMLSRLSGIPFEGSLERMSTNDAVTCFWGLARFFIPGLRGTPQATTSPKPDEQPAS